jgi:hypothetical protein
VHAPWNDGLVNQTPAALAPQIIIYPGHAPNNGYANPGNPFHQLPPNQTIGPIRYPNIEEWFQSLDEHNIRGQDGIRFSQYGAVLKAEGFIRLSQLTLEFLSLKDLQELLGIGKGTAVLLMQYAQEDINAIKAGSLTFPHAA